jgi:hypothetical protein
MQECTLEHGIGYNLPDHLPFIIIREQSFSRKVLDGFHLIGKISDFIYKECDTTHIAFTERQPAL